METFLNRVLWGNTVFAYLVAAAGILMAWIILSLTRKKLLVLLRKLAAKTSFTMDDFVVETAEKLLSIPAMIKEIVSAQPSVDFDRAHMKGFGDFSVLYEIVCYINSSHYVLFMDTHQEICLRMFEQFEATGIEFAYPTQTLFLKDDNKQADQLDVSSEMVSANGHQ